MATAKKLLAILSLWLLIGVVTPSSFAQSKEFAVDVPKGQPVVLRVPFVLLEQEGNTFTGSEIFVANVEEDQSGIQVSSVVDWKTRGFPLMIEFRVEKTSKKKESTEVELRPAAKGVAGPVIKLRFKPTVRDIKSSFRQLIALGSIDEFEASADFKEVMTAMAPRVFKGPLARVPDDAKIGFMRAASRARSGVSASSYDTDGLKGENHNNGYYCGINLGVHSEWFNTVKSNPSKRAATIIQNRFLPAFKGFAPHLASAGEAVQGIHFLLLVPSQNYLDAVNEALGNSARKLDKLELVEIYAPSARIQEWNQGKITDQQLVDAAEVLVDEKKVAVVLKH